MPRYFFHLREREDHVPDEEGIELADLDAADRLAVRGTRELLASAVLRGELPLSHTLEIADQRGDVLRTVSFAAAVTLV